MRSGHRGGPFAPRNQLYTLLNSGDASLAWAAGKDQDWLSLSSSGGVLHPGESTVLTTSFSTNANQLAPSSYLGHWAITNTTSGHGNAVFQVRLLVAQSPTLRVLANPMANLYSLRLTGQARQAYLLETSTNLVRWVTLSTNTASTSGTLDVGFVRGAGPGAHFYRARVQPR